MRQHSRVRSIVIVITALGLPFWLTACGADDSSSANSPAKIVDSGQADEPKDASDCGLDVPDDVSDFPVPDKCTVKAGADIGGTWRVLLGEVPGSLEEMKSFYQDGLAKAGWAVDGESPNEGKERTGVSATKADMKANIDIDFRNESLVSIELVRG